jgi:hypothetical protein
MDSITIVSLKIITNFQPALAYKLLAERFSDTDANLNVFSSQLHFAAARSLFTSLGKQNFHDSHILVTVSHRQV